MLNGFIINNITKTNDKYFIICTNDCNKHIFVDTYSTSLCISGINRILNCKNLNNFNIPKYKKFIMLKEFVHKLYKYIKNVNEKLNVNILSYRNEFKDVIKYYDEDGYECEFIFDYDNKDYNNTMFNLTYIENGMISKYYELIDLNKLNNLSIKKFLKEKFPKFIIC